MNERIAELRIQAWERVNELKPDERERDTVFANEFAQLIVEECLDITEKTYANFKNIGNLGGLTLFDRIQRTIQKQLCNEKKDGWPWDDVNDCDCPWLDESE